MMADGTIVAAFTELAPRYEDTMNRELEQYWGVSYGAFIAGLLDQLVVGEGDAVLDIATGTAQIPLALRRCGLPAGCVVGLDITPAMLARGREGVSAHSDGAVHLVCGSALALPFPDAFCDIVTCALGTHHMDAPRMLGEMRRVLRPGGRLALADVGATPFWRSLSGRALLRLLMWQYGLSQRSARGQAELEAFANVRTADEWEALLAATGFAQVEVNVIRARRPWYPCGLLMRGVAETHRTERPSF